MHRYSTARWLMQETSPQDPVQWRDFGAAEARHGISPALATSGRVQWTLRGFLLTSDFRAMRSIGAEPAEL
jgi:hypothetical protein